MTVYHIADGKVVNAVRIQRVTSKWAKTEALLADPAIALYVPVTERFSRENVASLLERFSMVYVKPVKGTFGRGVIRAERLDDDPSAFQMQAGERKLRFPAYDALYEGLLAAKRNRPYLVQQGIPLLTYEGRRFDLRVMVQKNTANRWETTGLIGRLAHPRKIVTNYHSGGTPMPIETLLAGYMQGPELDRYLSAISRLGIAIAASLELRYPRIKEIGVDVALDPERKPWILEVNTKPDPFIFKKLPNRSVFARIYRYCVAYGRFKRSKRRR